MTKLLLRSSFILPWTEMVAPIQMQNEDNFFNINTGTTCGMVLQECIFGSVILQDDKNIIFS